MDDLKAQWGNPPKPNMWKVREHNHSSNKDYVAVVSPILKNNGEFFVMRNEKQEWEIRYHDRFHRPLFIKRLKETHSFLEVRYYFLSSVCWSKDIGPFLKDNRNFFADGFSTKVASPVLKAKKIKHRAMWGDPLKPNMWKVESRWYAGGGEEFSFCSVESPVLKEGSFFQLMFDTSSKKWTIQYSGSTTFHVHTFHNTNKFLEARDIFLSRKGWKIIKTFALIAGTDFFRTKVASSPKLEAQWGNPVKTNAWKVEEHRDAWMGDYVEATSPVLGKDRAILLTSPAYNASRFYQIEIDLGDDNVRVITGYKSVCSYQKALEFFLSPKGWQIIHTWASKQSKPVFTTKVASSSDLQVMWGDPPKPNMWKIDEGRDGHMYYYEVKSPVLIGKGAIRLIEYGVDDQYWRIEWKPHPASKMFRVIANLDEATNEEDEALEIFLSPKGWRLISDWASKQSEPVLTTKVASSV